MTITVKKNYFLPSVPEEESDIMAYLSLWFTVVHNQDDAKRVLCVNNLGEALRGLYLRELHHTCAVCLA